MRVTVRPSPLRTEKLLELSKQQVIAKTDNVASPSPHLLAALLTSMAKSWISKRMTRGNLCRTGLQNSAGTLMVAAGVVHIQRIAQREKQLGRGRSRQSKLPLAQAAAKVQVAEVVHFDQAENKLGRCLHRQSKLVNQEERQLGCGRNLQSNLPLKQAAARMPVAAVVHVNQKENLISRGRGARRRTVGRCSHCRMTN